MNNLSREIPQGIVNLKSLINFNVFRNKFLGSLPSDIGLYAKLESFHMTINNFNGKLPKLGLHCV